MNAKHWRGIKNCKGKSEVLGVTPIPMTRFLSRGTIPDLRDQKPTLILAIKHLEFKDIRVSLVALHMQQEAVRFELSVSQFGALYGLYVYYLQVVYGGRVLDGFDGRILRTYMDEYMGDFLFDTFQPYHFYCDQFVDFAILNETDKDGYISK